MPTANLPTQPPRPPYVRLEVVEEMPDGEVRVHLGLDLRLPLNLADSEALALRMAGELARNAHAMHASAFMGAQFVGATGPGGGGGGGLDGATGGPGATANARAGASGGGGGKG